MNQLWLNRKPLDELMAAGVATAMAKVSPRPPACGACVSSGRWTVGGVRGASPPGRLFPEPVLGFLRADCEEGFSR